MSDMRDKSDEYWKKKLTPEQYRVLREKGTEAPGTGTYTEMYEDGMYHCAACNAALFESDSKYESTMPGLIGWPAFGDTKSDTVELAEDNSLGMRRTEAICKNCGSHLGHFFPDDSSPTGDHYCVNSVSLNFKPKS